MNLRLIAAFAVAVLFGLAQLLPWSGVTASRSEPAQQAISRISPSTALAAEEDEDNDEDEDDEDNDDSEDEDEDNDDADEDDSDNDDADEDNDDADEDDSDNDDADTDDGDNTSSAGDVAATPPPPPVDATLPATEATGTSNGTSDVIIRLGGERVVVTMFPWTPSGVTLVLKKVEPTTVAAAPGMRAGDLTFSIEARDATGKPLAAIPGEVNLAVRYNEADVAGLTESNLTISRLNPTANQWAAAPKQAKNAEGNYIAASISDPGTYTVHTP